MKRKKIIIVNAHWSNRGDEAAIRGIVEKIVQLKPYAEITILFKDNLTIKQFVPEWTSIRYEANKFLPNQLDYVIQIASKGKIGKNSIMKRCIKLLKGADYVVYAPGGSVINDRFWWKKQLEYMLPLICARQYKLPIFVAAPSFGPFDEKKKIKNRIRKWAFNTTNYFCVRESTSLEYLEKIHADKNVTVTIDSAFCYSIQKQTAEKQFSKDNELITFWKKYKQIIGITITDLSWNVKYKERHEISDKIKNSFMEFIQEMNKQSIGVILIPQLFGNQNDANDLGKFQCENVMTLSDEYDSEFQQYLISKLYIVIGMRYHSNIFAAKMGTPFLPIIYEEKMSAFIYDAGLNQYAIEVESLNLKLLIEKFNYIRGSYMDYKNDLLVLNERWKRSAEVTYKLMEKFFQKE